MNRVLIYGGLGNQMFQYAFARIWSKKLHTDYFLLETNKFYIQKYFEIDFNSFQNTKRSYWFRLIHFFNKQILTENQQVPASQEIVRFNTDKMVGYILLDLGLVVITDQSIINKFSETESVISYKTYSEKILVYNELVCQINRNEFNRSRNTTYSSGNVIKASEVGLYDNTNKLIALAKFNKHLELTGTQPITISIVLTL